MRRALRRRIAAWAVSDDHPWQPGPSAHGDADLLAGPRIRRLWRRLEPYLGPSYPTVALLGAVSIVGGFVEAGLIFFLVRIASALTSPDDDLGFQIGPLSAHPTVAQAFTIAFVALAVMSLLNIVGAVLTARLSVASLNRARKRTLGAFLGAGWSAQSREQLGHLQELLTTHVNKVSQAVLAVSTGLTATFSFLALMVSSIVILPLAAASIVLGVIVVGGMLLPFTRRTKRQSRMQKGKNAEYAMRVAETVDVAREINVFGVWDDVRTTMADRADAVARAGFVTRLLVRVNPLVYQSAVMGLLLLGMAGVYATGTGEVANIGAVVILMVRALSYSQQINGAFQQASEITPYVEEIESTEEHYRSQPSLGGDRPLDRVHSLALVDVTYGYEPGRPVLRDVSMEVNPGDVVGIVGPSGSGKSTLVQLLLRLRLPDAGRFEVNGEHADVFDRHAWAGTFALVPQDNRLISGTVHENIAFFRDIDRETVAAAARSAHLHDDIEALADGYDTRIGSGAMDLSGGQRQRLGLARALAGGPDVLILDEPTSALDMRSETLVQQTLEELRGSLTMFIVAHRISTLSVCDRILVLQDGLVTAYGTFEQVHEQSAFFRDAVELSRLPA